MLAGLIVVIGVVMFVVALGLSDPDNRNTRITSMITLVLLAIAGGGTLWFWLR